MKKGKSAGPSAIPRFVKNEIYDIPRISFESAEAVKKFVDLYNKAKEVE